MSKFKTFDCGGATKRQFNGLIKVCSTDREKNYKVKLMLLNGLRNRNGWVYENIDKHLNEFGDIPILYSVINGKIANGHDFEIVRDSKTGKEYASFIGAESEHPAGWIPLKINGVINPHIENINGVDWVVAEGVIPSYYNKEFLDELEANGGQKQVSIETLVQKYRIEADTEFEEVWSVIGVTVLSVREAVAGANIRKLSANIGQLEELKLRAASYYEQETHIEPQTQNKNQNSKKGATRTMAKVLNLEDLKGKFNGYTVLGANGLTVALLSDKGRTCSYTFLENEDTVVPERIEEIAVNSVFGEGDGAISVSAEQLIGSIRAQLNSAQTALDKKTEENTKLTEKINVMTEAEKKRRKKVVEKAIKDSMKENKDLYKDDIDEHLCDDLLTDECLTNYAEMEDKDGFCGDSAARKEVNNRCMEKLKEAQKAKNNAAQKKYAWELGGDGDEGTPDSGINSAIENILK